jgi:hypothetical protein
MNEHWQSTDNILRAVRRERILDLWAAGLGQDEIAEQVGEFRSAVGWIVARARALGDSRATRHDSFANASRRLPPTEQTKVARIRRRVARAKAGTRFPASVSELSALARASDVAITKCPPGIPFTGIPTWAGHR